MLAIGMILYDICFVNGCKWSLFLMLSFTSFACNTNKVFISITVVSLALSLLAEIERNSMAYILHFAICMD